LPLVKLFIKKLKADYDCGRFCIKVLTGMSDLMIGLALKNTVLGVSKRLGNYILDGDIAYV